MEEIFKPVDGFEGLYEISNLGRLFSLNYDGTKKRKEIHCGSNKDGYKQCVLYKNGVKFCKKLHRLVAYAFLDNPNNYPQVNHKDENKSNNAADNLEWCTVKYNANYGSRNDRISLHSNVEGRPVKSIDNYGNVKVYKSIREAQDCTDIERSNISACCRNKRNHAGGLKWSYC